MNLFSRTVKLMIFYNLWNGLSSKPKKHSLVVFDPQSLACHYWDWVTVVLKDLPEGPQMQHWPRFHFWPGGRNPTAPAACGHSLSIWGFLPGMLMLLSAFCPSPLRHGVRLAVCVSDCGCKKKKKKLLLLLHFLLWRKAGTYYRSGGHTSCNIRQHLYLSSILYSNVIAMVYSWKDGIAYGTSC